MRDKKPSQSAKFWAKKLSDDNYPGSRAAVEVISIRLVLGASSSDQL